MKKSHFFIGFLFVLISCSTAKQGKVKQGKDGKIENAVITAKCTPPQKSYAKEIEAKLKAEMDSLKFTPSTSFDASFNQKVIKLREYSSQGLDWDLLAFRICEMSNNRGLTSEQTSNLLTKALDLWENAQKSTQTQKPTQVAFSVNQQGGITASNVYLPETKFLLSSMDKSQLLKLFPNKEKSITISSVVGNEVARDLAVQISDFLKTSGYNKVGEFIGQFIQSPIINGVSVDTISNEIKVGYLKKTN
jgi:hypothetical protein